MDDITTKLTHLESELIEMKVNCDLMETKLVSHNGVNYDLQCRLREIDCAILSAQNELNNKINGSQQAKEVIGYCQYVQDVTKRWMSYFNKMTSEYQVNANSMVPSENDLVQMVTQFIEIKNQILANREMKLGWTRDSVKRFTENLLLKVKSDVEYDFRHEREEFNILQSRIQRESELLKYTVKEDKLEPPAFKYIRVKPFVPPKLTDSEFKFSKDFLKLIGNQMTRRKEIRPMDYQQAGSSNVGQIANNCRHQQQQFPSQTIKLTQSQEIFPSTEPEMMLNSEMIDDYSSKGSNHRVNIGESHERSDEPVVPQPVRNHVKFEDTPRVNQYSGRVFDQPETDSRKRKHPNDLSSPLDKVVNEETPEYVNESSNAAKKGKFEPEKNEARFGSNYFERDFLTFPNATQQEEDIFSFTQDFQDLEEDFFDTKTDPDEDASIKGVF